MLVHAPAKLNLCLYLGRPRDDGLHELCSLFEPLALADLIEVSAAERDEVICPGVEGENLAARALAALRAAGWEHEPLRIEIEKRVPVAAGLGGGSGDAAAVLRLAAGEVDDLQRIAAGLGADVPSQLRPALALVRGAGERVEPLPAPAAHAAVLLPDGGGLSTAAVFAEADRLGLGREPEELERAGGAAARGRRRRRLAARLSRAARQRPRGAGALAAAGDRRRARRAARSRRPGRDPERLRPDRGRALRRPRRRPRRGRDDRPRRRDRLRGGGGAVRMQGDEREGGEGARSPANGS